MSMQTACVRTDGSSLYAGSGRHSRIDRASSTDGVALALSRTFDKLLQAARVFCLQTNKLNTTTTTTTTTTPKQEVVAGGRNQAGAEGAEPDAQDGLRLNSGPQRTRVIARAVPAGKGDERDMLEKTEKAG